MEGTSEERKYACRQCSRRYNKAEHLLRHEHAHTGAKPFICRKCGRRFTRLDSLTRHHQRSGHSEDSSITSRVQERAADESMIWSDQQLPTEQSFDSHIDLNNNGADSTLLNEADITDDPFFQLTWPASEDLLQSILSTNVGPGINDIALQQTFMIPESCNRTSWARPAPVEQPSESVGWHPAIQEVSKIIADLSTNVTNQASLTRLSTTFLDECLHLFFDRFIPVFPVMHQPTFEHRECAHPLLLNAIAIGSLFSGNEQHTNQGEALWKLAHTAVATSWHSLIQLQARHDPNRGVQLVATALLGQAYAILSRNSKLRMTAQIFHSLGFYWASECSMYAPRKPIDTSQIIEASEVDLGQLWREWAAGEIQLRVLLGHYILDSQIAEFLGAPTSQRHTANALPLPCSNALFEAPTAQKWAEMMLLECPDTSTFRELFYDLYAASDASKSLPLALSPFTLKVLLEGIRSLIIEAKDATGPIVGSPPLQTTIKVLGVLHDYISASIHLSASQRTDFLLAWHAVCINLCIDNVKVCRDLCSARNVTQDVFSSREDRTKMTDFRTWVVQPRAHIALLHAHAIYKLLDDVVLSQAHVLHLPMSVSSAATAYCAFINAGRSVVSLPQPDWAEVGRVHSMLYERDRDLAGPSLVSQSDVQAFVFGRDDPRLTAKVNLRYQMNAFLLRLRQMSEPWGIAAKLETIFQALLSSILEGKESDQHR